MAGISIRFATIADTTAVYDLICALESTCFPFGKFAALLQQNLADVCWTYWLAETDGRPVGMISLHIQRLLHHCGLVGEIQEFVVDAGYRGRGIGRALVEAARRYAHANDIVSLEVTTNKRRVENMPVYEKLGFSLTHNKFTMELEVEDRRTS